MNIDLGKMNVDPHTLIRYLTQMQVIWQWSMRGPSDSLGEHSGTTIVHEHSLANYQPLHNGTKTSYRMHYICYKWGSILMRMLDIWSASVRLGRIWWIRSVGFAHISLSCKGGCCLCFVLPRNGAFPWDAISRNFYLCLAAIDTHSFMFTSLNKCVQTINDCTQRFRADDLKPKMCNPPSIPELNSFRESKKNRRCTLSTQGKKYNLLLYIHTSL